MKVSLLRVFLGLVALAAWSAAMLSLASAPAPVAFAAGLLYTVPLVSLWEWVTHGVLYHQGLPGLKEVLRIHVGGHHLSLFPPRIYVRQGPYSFMRFRRPRTPWRMSDQLLDTLLTSGSQTALHFVLGVPTILWPAYALVGSGAFFTGAIAALSVLSVLLTWVHGVIHNPSDRLVEKMRWFQWLDRHHYIHHVDMASNMNFLLPICDLLFGTQKAALTAEEVARNPSFEQAKPMAWDVRGRARSAG